MQEDLTPSSVVAVLEGLARGEPVKPGPQNGRLNSAPDAEKRTLKEKVRRRPLTIALRTRPVLCARVCLGRHGRPLLSRGLISVEAVRCTAQPGASEVSGVYVRSIEAGKDPCDAEVRRHHEHAPLLGIDAAQRRTNDVLDTKRVVAAVARPRRGVDRVRSDERVLDRAGRHEKEVHASASRLTRRRRGGLGLALEIDGAHEEVLSRFRRAVHGARRRGYEAGDGADRHDGRARGRRLHERDQGAQHDGRAFDIGVAAALDRLADTIEAILRRMRQPALLRLGIHAARVDARDTEDRKNRCRAKHHVQRVQAAHAPYHGVAESQHTLSACEICRMHMHLHTGIALPHVFQRMLSSPHYHDVLRSALHVLPQQLGAQAIRRRGTQDQDTLRTCVHVLRPFLASRVRPYDVQEDARHERPGQPRHAATRGRPGSCADSAVLGMRRGRLFFSAMSFEAPPGYVRADTAQASDAWERADEVWVMRVPDGVDVRKLDGVTIPLDAFERADHAPLASVRVSETDTYDVLVAHGAAEESDSQLIDMAGPSTTPVFLQRDFLRSADGVASELQSVCALLPRAKDATLRMKPVARRMYMARRTASAKGRDHGYDVSLPPKHTQPWDRLQGVFRPAGSQAKSPALPDKKRKKASSDEASKKKKKKK